LDFVDILFCLKYTHTNQQMQIKLASGKRLMKVRKFSITHDATEDGAARISPEMRNLWRTDAVLGETADKRRRCEFYIFNLDTPPTRAPELNSPPRSWKGYSLVCIDRHLFDSSSDLYSLHHFHQNFHLNLFSYLS